MVSLGMEFKHNTIERPIAGTREGRGSKCSKCNRLCMSLCLKELVPARFWPPKFVRFRKWPISLVMSQAQR